MKLTEIPEIFFNSKTKSPFEDCLICNKKLLKPETDYLIIKGYRYYKEYNKKDITLEISLCCKCEEMLDESYSDESMQRLHQYFSKNFNQSKILNRFKSKNYNIDDWISHCACKDKHWKQTNSYYIYGWFNSSKLIYDFYQPYMLSDEVMDELVILLSNDTIDSLTKFSDIYTDFPPEFRKIFSKRITHS
jgi:hypothetical protein